MTTDTTDSAQGGAVAVVQEQAAGPVADQGGGNAAGAVQFSAEQQAAVDRLIAERLRRAQQKWQDDLKARAASDADAAEAKRLADEKRYEELARKREAEAAELKAKLAQMEHDQLRRDADQAAGIPQLWQRLQGETAEALAEDAKALAAMVQPAAGGGRTATTSPTPPAQSGQQDFVRQAIERQQKRATFNDPYAEMMRR